MEQNFGQGVKQLDIHPEAVEEVSDALRFYGERTADGIADDLNDIINSALDVIANAIRSAILIGKRLNSGAVYLLVFRTSSFTRLNRRGFMSSLSPTPADARGTGNHVSRGRNPSRFQHLIRRLRR